MNPRVKAKSKADSIDISVLEQIDKAFPFFLDLSEKFEAGPKGEMRLVKISKKKGAAKKENIEKSQKTGIAGFAKDTESLVFAFQDYLNTIKKLQIFQNANDSAAYQEWIAKESRKGARLFIALRKWGKRIEAKDLAAWQNKYVELAKDEKSISPEQVTDLHKNIKCFDAMQTLLGRFRQVVAKQPKGIAQAIQMIWPEVKSILNGEWSSELMLSRLELATLKVTDPSVQIKVKALLNALFQKAEMISHQFLGTQNAK